MRSPTTGFPLAFAVLVGLSAQPAEAQALDTVKVEAERPQPLSRVSLVHLLARPEAYADQTVVVSGYLHVRFEDSALYLSKTDGDYLRGENAAWVEYAERCVVEALPIYERRPCDQALREMDGRYVRLQGRFVPGVGGHMNLFNATLEHVSWVEESRRWYDGSKRLPD